MEHTSDREKRSAFIDGNSFVHSNAHSERPFLPDHIYRALWEWQGAWNKALKQWKRWQQWPQQGRATGNSADQGPPPSGPLSPRHPASLVLTEDRGRSLGCHLETSPGSGRLQGAWEVGCRCGRVRVPSSKLCCSHILVRSKAPAFIIHGTGVQGRQQWG